MQQNATIQATAQKMHNVIVSANENGDLPSEIELLQTGYWDSPTHGQFYIGEDDIPLYIENFNNDVRAHSSTTGIPIDFEHKTDGGAGAWIKKLEQRPNDRGGISIWGSIEWTTVGASAIKGGVYKFISPEFAPRGYYDPEGRAPDTDCVLLGAGFTNRPLFKGLAYVKASDTSGNAVDDNNSKESLNMDLATIRSKAIADLTDEEKAYVAEHKDELTADERVTYGLESAPVVEEAPAEATAEEAAPVEAEAETVEVTPVVATPVTASEGQVVISASELEQIKLLASEATAAREALAAKQASEEIISVAFSASDNGQKFKSDQKADVVSFYLSCNDEQRKAFTSLVSAMPSVVSASDFASTGSSKEVSSTASAQAGTLMEKANAIVAASDGSMTFSAALQKVAKDEPELAQAYEKSLKEGN